MIRCACNATTRPNPSPSPNLLKGPLAPPLIVYGRCTSGRIFHRLSFRRRRRVSCRIARAPLPPLSLSLSLRGRILTCFYPFQALLEENPAKHPIIILKDVPFQHLTAILEFMYAGEVNVAQDQLPAFLKTAERLKVKGLAEAPQTIKQE